MEVRRLPGSILCRFPRGRSPRTNMPGGEAFELERTHGGRKSPFETGGFFFVVVVILPVRHTGRDPGQLLSRQKYQHGSSRSWNRCYRCRRFPVRRVYGQTSLSHHYTHETKSKRQIEIKVKTKTLSGKKLERTTRSVPFRVPNQSKYESCSFVDFATFGSHRNGPRTGHPRAALQHRGASQG